MFQEPLETVSSVSIGILKFKLYNLFKEQHKPTTKVFIVN